MIERCENYGFSERKEVNKPKPYVVSGDINVLLQKWAQEKGFLLPENEFMVELRSDFGVFMKQIFPNFDFIPEEELSQGLTNQIEQTGLFPISMDRVYYATNPGLDVARLVGEEGQDKGLGARQDSPALLQQFRKLKEFGINEAVVIDDVIFSGEMMKRVITTLSTTGIKVPVVCAGIAIQEGIDTLTNSDTLVRAVRIYDDVIDEICERDFYPGVPLSGRLMNESGNVGAPYILPFGNPGKWASIPEEWQKPFSKFCIEQTMKLFESIENASERIVRCSNLDRNVVSLPRDETRYIDALRSSL